ncbi:MAG: uroporphyrinogen decarboxylase family protein [Candidatus Poribacteria bacterium]
MLGRERVLAAFAHEQPDRVPRTIWMFREDVRAAVTERHGSVDAFFDFLDLDSFQTFPSKGMWPGGVSSIDDALDATLTDPNDPDIYTTIKRDIEFQKGDRGRAIFCQTPGVFETTNGVLGIENSLMHLAMNPGQCHELYAKIARWAGNYARNCLQLGVDIVHISDDWGQNQRMMMRPEVWREHIFPTESITVEAAREAGGRVSVHCDGYFYDVLDDLVRMGVQCVHPVQQSAGMDVARFKREYAGRLALYGGLDIRHTLPRGTLGELADEVRDLFRTMKPGGGFVFCTGHTVQPDTTLERVEFAYRIADEESAY